MQQMTPPSILPIVTGLTTVSLSAVGGVMVGARLTGSPLVLPCPMDELFGLACPVCGTFRAGTALARGDLPVAGHQWTASSVVVLLSLGGLFTLYQWARRRWPSVRVSRWYLGLLTVALGANWAAQLVKVTSTAL